MTHTATTSRRSAHTGPVVVALLATAVVAAFAFGPVGWGQWLYLGGVLAAVLTMAVVVRRRPDLRPWRWITVGMGCSALADLAWAVATPVGAGSAGWYVIDLVYLCAYAAIVRGLLLFTRDRTPAPALDRAIELWSLLVVMGLGAWLMMVGPALESGQGWVGQLVALGYPVADVALLSMTIWLFVVRGGRGTRGEPGLVHLGVGLAAWLAGDIGYVVLTQLGSEDPGVQRALDTAWLGGALLIGLACVRAATTTRADVGEDPVARSGGWARVVVGAVLVVVPVGTETLRRAVTGDDPPWAVLVASVALIGLSLARTLRLKGSSDRAWELLRSSERRAHALALNSSDAVLVLDAQGRLLDGQDNAQRLLATSEPIAVGSDPLGVVDPEDRYRAQTVLQRCASSPGQVISTELRLTSPDGTSRWYSFRAVNLLHDPDVGGLVVNVHDVHDRKQVEDELVHRAFHDALTGLANRALFHDRVRHALERNAGACAVLFMDLDGFKAVNDGLGHDAGDELLKVVADRLRATTPVQYTVARLGGDEFAVLVDDTDGVHDRATELAGRLLQVVSDVVDLDGEPVRLGVSIGVAVGAAGTDPSALLRNADLAMYQVKTTGRGRWMTFDERMEADARERVRIERDLAVAVEGRQLRLAYQPVVQLATERLVGFEALVRWQHPELGELQPERFIPVAEASGLIVPVGTWVLQEACRTMSRWQREFPHDPPLTMSVNVAAQQLADPDFLGVVADALGRAGLAPERLVLEITETSLISEAEHLSHSLAGLRGMGVRLAIDDFGTGYSSLSYLRRFPVDIVKIDQEFIHSIDDGVEVPALLRGLLDLGRTLGLEVVAEGVETDAQVSGLIAQHCSSAQGFYFSEPLETEDAEVRLAGSFSPSAGRSERPGRTTQLGGFEVHDPASRDAASQDAASQDAARRDVVSPRS